ncbi:MAG: AAA family ATPase [Planctomycetota bacterium]
MDYNFIHRIAIAGYRSIRALTISLGQLNVVTGPNGCGKSNLYRALGLLSNTAQGQLVASLAREGGLSSVLWAGPESMSGSMQAGTQPVQGTLRKKPVALKLGIAAEPFSYCFDLGLPVPSASMFSRDPEMKRECLWRGIGMDAPSLCADRKKSTLRCRSAGGKWQDVDMLLHGQSSMLSEYLDPFGAPEIILMKQVLASWRFYDTFRTDSDSPARRVQPGTFTPVMASDGSNLAAALQTVREIGDSDQLNALIDQAFPGCRARVVSTDSGLELLLDQPGMLRELSVAEVSDGTLRFLLLVTALLSPRPPAFLVLNEPENSLHPELIPALATLISKAAERSQVLVVSHSQALVSALEEHEDCVSLHLQKKLGETTLVDSNALDQFGWKWPSR